MKNVIRIIKLSLLALVIALGFYLGPTRVMEIDLKSQYPNLPNGCEVTALSMLISHEGINVRPEQLSDNFLKKSGLTNANPDLAYIGNPRSNSRGYYAYARPIVECANSYFESIGARNYALDKTGMNILSLLHSVAISKKPVAVWYTTDGKSPEYSVNSYTDERGERVSFYKNLHCVVVHGLGKGMVYIADPIHGKKTVNFIEFAKIYYQMGQRAIVVK